MQISKSVELAEKFIENSKIFGEKCSFGSPDSRVEIPSKYLMPLFKRGVRKYWNYS